MNTTPYPDTPDTAGSLDTLRALADTIAQRRSADPAKSYVAKLVHKGLDSMLKKVGEEATEVVIAAKDGDREQIVYEMADLWFHSLIVLSQFDLGPEDVLAELRRREGLSGLQEFAQRSQPGPAAQS
jgi:phosphoribosyl-ATP pyrophosphohydrolase